MPGLLWGPSDRTSPFVPKTRWWNTTTRFPPIAWWHCPPASKFSYSRVTNCVRKLPMLLYRVLTKVFDSIYNRVFLILAKPSSKMEQLLAAILATPLLIHEVCFKHQPRFSVLFFNDKENGKPKMLNLVINLALQHNKIKTKIKILSAPKIAKLKF